MNGWINLDKPVGMSSAAAVARVKRLLSILPPWGRSGVSLGEGFSDDTEFLQMPSPYPLPKGEGFKKEKIKIGHAGTLDPLASGILPLALGEATKTVQYMMDAAKAYQFTVSWGQERDTDDAAGEVIKSSEIRPTLAQINQIITQFIGDITQTPPNYSAIKLGGKRAYSLARSGEEVAIKPRQVFIKSLEIIQRTTNHELRTTDFLCHCGKGTYIRSIARDMGRLIGCYGYISALRRIKVGKFDEASAISLEILENMVHKGELNFLQAVESALDDILAWEANSTQATDLRHGKKIFVPELSSHHEKIILVKYDKNPLAICELAAGVMKPLRVFNL